MRFPLVFTVATLLCAACSVPAFSAEPTLQFVRMPSPQAVPVAKVASDPVEPSWSADQLEAIALQNNPAVAIATAKVDQAAGLWHQAGLYPNPVAGYVGNEMGDAGTSGQQGGFIGQQIVTAGKLKLDRGEAYHRWHQAHEQLNAARLRVQTDVRGAYFAVLAQQRRTELSRWLVDVSRETTRSTEQLLQAAEAARTDLLQARIEQGRAELAAESAAARQAAAWRRLTAVVGYPELTMHPLDGDFEKLRPRLTWETTLERLNRESPTVAAAMAEVERTQCAFARAQAGAVPNVDVQFGMRHNNESGESVTDVQVAVPLPLWNRNQGAIQAAYADYVAAERNVERVRLALQRQLADVFADFRRSRADADRFATEILPQAEEMLGLVQRRYRAGDIGYLELLTAQRTYFQTSLSFVDALEKMNQSALRIEGLLLHDSLDPQ